MMFVFFIPWILLSSNRWNFLGVLLCVVLFTCVSSQDLEVQKEEFLLKSHKVIEAGPNVLRRVQSLSGSGLPEDWDCEPVGACDDPTGYEAIRGLHRQLDDDANGSIDVTETDEFLRDELQYENGRHKERHKEFHGNDKYINVDELWQVWKTSEVHNWTVDQTVEWLITQVDLPQYEHNFRNNGVNGASLPLLAQNTHNFISHNLGIKDSIHKQKIALKAMDVVLFGLPKYHNYYKDFLLGVFLAIALGGCWFALVQHKNSQTHMQKMMKDMEALQKAEDSLCDLQRELSKARHEQEIVSIEKQDLERRLKNEMTTSRKFLEHAGSESFDCAGPEEGVRRVLELERELSLVRSDLREAEKKLEARHWVAPTALQHWLQLTYELELRNYNAKKAIAEQQLHAAKEGCEKLSKKRATFMGAFRIAHGSSIDDVDDRIVKAKSALYEVTNDLQERMHRWKQVELLCGVPIIVNPGLASLESLLLLPPSTSASKAGNSGSTHSGLNTLSKSSSDATLREESPPPYTGVVQSPPANIPPPTYSKTSPSFLRKGPEPPAFFPQPSRVVYPKECYRPLENVSSLETDAEELHIPEKEDEPVLLVAPGASSSSPDAAPPRAVFTIADGSNLREAVPRRDPPDLPAVPAPHQLTADPPNGRMGDFVRKISAGLLSDRRKKPGSLVIEALKKSASSSNITDGASSDSSSGILSEEKAKKKKFFQTLRHRKPKV